VAQLTEQPTDDEGPPAVPEPAQPGCPPGTLRFVAHLGLALSQLGLIPHPHDVSASLLYRSMQVRIHVTQA
jgi:hypothetical protein